MSNDTTSHVDLDFNNNSNSNSSSSSKDDHEQDMVMPGFRFHPTEEELVEFYLRRKVEGKRFNVELITFLDLYRHDPWELPGIYMYIIYFLCINHYHTSYIYTFVYIPIKLQQSIAVILVLFLGILIFWGISHGSDWGEGMVLLRA